MAGGINFSIGGKLDPSFRAALAQSVTESRLAGIEISRAFEKAQMLARGHTRNVQDFAPIRAIPRSSWSTIVNPNQIKTEAQSYADFWEKELAAATAKQTGEQVAQARRDIEARRLRRMRAERRAGASVVGVSTEGTTSGVPFT